jgi:hypothetical protein
MLLRLTRNGTSAGQAATAGGGLCHRLRWRVVRRPECLLVRPLRCRAGESDVESEGFDLADVTGDLAADGGLPFVVRAEVLVPHAGIEYTAPLAGHAVLVNDGAAAEQTAPPLAPNRTI